MDEQELLREIKDYADALGRAEQHRHRDGIPEEGSALVSTRTTPSRARRSVLVAVVLATVLAAGGIAAVVVNRSSSPQLTVRSAGSSTSVATGAVHVGPRLPRAVLDWLRTYTAHDSLGRATSADWVLTTHGKAAILVSGAAPGDMTPVYLFDVHGNFVWDHSCPPGSRPSACRSVGADEVFTVDPRRLQVLDFGVGGPAKLARFGVVGHVTLASTRATTSAPAACTSADLEARGAVPVPTPGIVTHHIYYVGSLSSVDPPSDTQPAITAAKAWQLAQKFRTRSPRGTYDILLGNISSATVSTRLAWLIIGHHVPSAPVGGAVPAPGVTTPPQPPCYFTDLLQPVDATTGQTLFIETGELQAPKHRTL